MKRMAWFWTVAVLCLLVPGISEGAAGTHFSANMISTSQGRTFEAKIYVGENKMRMDMPQNIMIVRMDRNTSYMIMPSQGMYMEQPIDRSKMMKTSKEVEGELERVAMGPESVNGQAAQKFKVTYRDGQAQAQMFQWIGDSEIPVKMAAVDGSWSVEYRDISKGTPDDSLFEIPVGLRKLEMPNMAQVMAAAQNAQNSN